MTEEWTFTSPLALLKEWQARPDEARLRELLLLGFTVDLPFLEQVAVPAARALGARITVIGDAAIGPYDPIDVRLAGRAYVHGHAACRRAFHPKLALLAGDHDVVAAVGSGNPTMAGWGYNDELWTVLRGSDIAAPAALVQIGTWLRDLAGHASVPVPRYLAGLLGEIAERLTALPVAADDADDVRVLHNLERPLLDQLPHGPVDELCLCAPFLDGSGDALRRIIDRFTPGRVVIGVQEHWTSYDGDTIVRTLAGRETEVHRLPEEVPRHGKLLEWSAGGVRHALTGSANLTRSALLTPTAAGGNCELAVLAAVERSLMPAPVTVRPVDWLRDRRTVRPMPSRPALLLLGAQLTGTGLEVTLARPYATDVAVETSPDGSPGSWTAIGAVPAGETVGLFAAAAVPGAAVRARVAGDPPMTSPAVFAVQPGRCGPRPATDRRPRLRRAFTEEEILTDPGTARRFRRDLLRLAGELPRRHATDDPAGPAAAPPSPQAGPPAPRAATPPHRPGTAPTPPRPAGPPPSPEVAAPPPPPDMPPAPRHTGTSPAPPHPGTPPAPPNSGAPSAALPGVSPSSPRAGAPPAPPNSGAPSAALPGVSPSSPRAGAPPAASPPGTPSLPAAAFAMPGRWEAYLEDCEDIIGRPLTGAVFGRSLPGLPGSPAWPAWGADVTTPIGAGLSAPPEESAGTGDAASAGGAAPIGRAGATGEQPPTGAAGTAAVARTAGSTGRPEEDTAPGPAAERREPAPRRAGAPPPPAGGDAAQHGTTGEDRETASSPMPAQERAAWRSWIADAVRRAAPDMVEAAPALVVRMLVARLFVRLLGHGVWDPGDLSWRPDLARLARRLPPVSADDVPEEALPHAAVLTAVCAGLLHGTAGSAGAAPGDDPAAHVWPEVRELVAGADADLAGDLLLPPALPGARVLAATELEYLIERAGDPAG